MNGSRTIRVVKRDEREEAFEADRLAASMYQAMLRTAGSFYDASQLALAIGMHLERNGPDVIRSADLFQLCLDVLRRVRLTAAAERLEAHREWRQRRRQALRVRHDGGQVTLWDKSWVGDLASRTWHLSPRAGRVIAAQIEAELLGSTCRDVPRRDVEEAISERVVAFGLADAVPLELGARLG